MRGNRYKDTKPEIALRKALWNSNIRGYRKNLSTLPGKPDIVYPKQKIAIFVNGCFWHKCPSCKKEKYLKKNASFWLSKMNQNAQRDLDNYKKLKALGYKALVVWECDLKKNQEAILTKIRSATIRTIQL